MTSVQKNSCCLRWNNALRLYEVGTMQAGAVADHSHGIQRGAQVMLSEWAPGWSGAGSVLPGAPGQLLGAPTKAAQLCLLALTWGK